MEYLPFESVWKMQIDHPYSLFVREADLYWSCGQCPLNEQGQVQSPNDLFTQATLVCGFIKKFLSEIRCNVASVDQLVVYYVANTTSANTAITNNNDKNVGKVLRDLFHEYFGPSVMVLTIAIPHFYYNGMMIEVDVFGSTASEKGKQRRTFSLPSSEAGSSFRLDIVDGRQLKCVSLLVPKISSVGPNLNLKEAFEYVLQDAWGLKLSLSR